MFIVNVDCTGQPYKHDCIIPVRRMWRLPATCTMPCKSKMQYLLTWKVSRYCRLALHGGVTMLYMPLIYK